MEQTDKPQTLFAAIKEFILELHSSFNTKFYSLVLYNRLLTQTESHHIKAIEKHNNGFIDYCNANKDAILERDETKLSDNSISYSVKVSLNLKEILRECTKETKDVIWKHLVYIFLLTSSDDLKDKVKGVLMELNEKKDTGLQVDDPFIQSILDKVSNQLDCNSASSSTDPMAAITSLLSSGLLPEIMSSVTNEINSGKMNINSIMKTVTALSGSNPMIKDMMKNVLQGQSL